MNKKVIYYQNELEDDFAGIKRESITIDESYVYLDNSILFKFIKLVVYHIVMRPFAYVYTKLAFHAKFENAKVIKPYKNKSIFIYGNHTSIPTDAFIPNILTYPKSTYFVVHPDNIALRGTRTIMKSLGALPTPTTTRGFVNFNKTIEELNKKKKPIVIFPEAHVWPYYTKIRDFKSVSFKFPAKLNAPVFCFTTTYQKKHFRRKPKMTIYIDGPFFSNPDLSIKENTQYLRDIVYNKMVERSLNSTYEYITYIKK